MADLSIFESGNGGDVERNGDNIVLTEGLFVQIYLAMFGGNVEGDTISEEISDPSIQNKGWWGNNVLFEDDPQLQFNSKTERTLNTTPLTPAGRQVIQAAVQEDMEFLSELGEVNVVVTIPDVDKVQIVVTIQQPTEEQPQNFIFLWDGTRNEVITNRVI